MASATAAIFRELAQRGYDPSLRSVEGTCRFDIAGEGSWWVAVADGMLTVKESTDEADCVCCLTCDDFLQMARGERNPLTATLQGRVAITGDSAIALLIQRLLFVPPVSRGRAPRRAE